MTEPRRCASTGLRSRPHSACVATRAAESREVTCTLHSDQSLQTGAQQLGALSDAREPLSVGNEVVAECHSGSHDTSCISSVIR